MKKQLLFLFISIIALNCYAQVTFEEGYFIDNTGEETKCLIKNFDWKNTPTKFQYKLSENTVIKTKTIKTVKEFGLLNNLKYNRFTINIDRSESDINKMSSVKKATFKEEQIYLKVLVEGLANLYVYEDGSLRRYFYRTEHSITEQLIHKNYITTDNKIGENNGYKQQLWNSLKCDNITIKNIENINYHKNDLVKIFVKYNECSNSKFINFERNEKKGIFHLTIRPGLKNSSLSVTNSGVKTSSLRNLEFESETGFRLGIEAEYVLPIYKYKLAFFVEPTYQNYKSDVEAIYYGVATPRKTIINADYKSIEIPFGVRYYSFLSKSSKLFLNAALVIDIPLSSSFYDDSKETALMDLDIKSGSSIDIGFGYKYQNKYSLELKYGLKRDLIIQSAFQASSYTGLSLIFGYTIL